jgi:hypothetical protein
MGVEPATLLLVAQCPPFVELADNYRTVADVPCVEVIIK